MSWSIQKPSTAWVAERRIALRVPHFSVLPEGIATTDLLLEVPASTARRFAAQHSIQDFDLPLTVRKIEVMRRRQEHSGDICQTVRECAAHF
jgi:hypothetical protein